jgi:hypothetical protein
MEFFIKTNKQQLTISLDIDVKGNEIIMVGYDPTRNNTEYFNRLILDSGHYEFNLPQSPNLLKVMVFEVVEGNTVKSNKYRVYNVKVSKLVKSQLLVDEKTGEFIRFAQWFSENSGTTNPGNFYSLKRNYKIQYVQDIQDTVDTPSRIHKITGVIDVSKNWFDGMTIAGRMAILLHEFAHNNLEETDDYDENEVIEKEADANAKSIYMALGYPQIEWTYAWTHIFKDNEKHIDRLISSNPELAGL